MQNRIRKSGGEHKKQNPLMINEWCIGFCVFKLDNTNMTDVHYSLEEYSQNLLSTMESNVKSDCSDFEWLFGCLLEWDFRYHYHIILSRWKDELHTMILNIIIAMEVWLHVLTKTALIVWWKKLPWNNHLELYLETVVWQTVRQKSMKENYLSYRHRIQE